MNQLIKGTIVKVTSQSSGYTLYLDNTIPVWVTSTKAIRKLATAFGITTGHESYAEQLVGKEIYYGLDFLGIATRIAPATVVDGVEWIYNHEEDPKKDENYEGQYVD